VGSSGAGLSFRTVTGDDLAWVLGTDPGSATDARRDHFLRLAVADRRCEIALVGDERAGFAVWHRQFFSRPFLALLIVLPAHRRRGTGTRLVRHLVERLAQGDTFFTSTNESNVAAQRFFEKLGFVRSGRIENLDPGDPELIYALPPDR